MQSSGIFGVHVRFLHNVEGNDEHVGALIHYTPLRSSFGTNWA